MGKDEDKGETRIGRKETPFHFSRDAINNIVSIHYSRRNLGGHLRDRPRPTPSHSYLPRKYILMRVIYQPGRQGQNLKYWIKLVRGRPVETESCADG